MKAAFFDIEPSKEILERFQGKVDPKDLPDAIFENFRQKVSEVQNRSREDRDSGRIDDQTILVFRLPPFINWQWHTSLINVVSDQLRAVGTGEDGRNPDNPQVLLYSADYDHLFECLSDPGGNLKTLGPAKLLDRLKAAEFTRYTQQGRALYEHGETAIFLTPSGKERRYFLRVGNMQCCPGFSRSAFYWALPYLEDVTHIHADSWSISTLVAKFAKYLNIYRRQKGRECDWSHAYSYIPNSHEEKNEIASLSERHSHAKGKGKLLLLNSFNSSGRLEEVFGEITRGTSAGMLSLFADTDICRPKHDFLHDIAPCLRLAGLRSPVQVHKEKLPIFETDKHTYFPDYRRPNVETFRFGDLEYDKSFFERYAGQGIFRVNRRGRTTSRPDDPGRMRHHGYYVDGKKLFAHPAFKAHLRKRWGKRRPPTAILVNGSRTASILCQTLKARFAGQAFEVLNCSDPTYARLPGTDGLEKIIRDPEQRLLIIVPMVISGATLANVQKKMRELGTVACQFSYLIGLLRPASLTKLKQLKGVYLERQENRDECWRKPVIVEDTLLPNWQEEDCPWQREKRHMEGALDRGAECSKMRERMHLLDAKTVEGLCEEDVFYVRDNARLQFNPESLWLDDRNVSGESNEGDLCCAVASGLQYWREAVRKKDRRFNTIDIAIPMNLNGFNEPRLMAAIWRALTPRELITAARAEGDHDLKAAFEKIFLGPNDPYFSPLRREAILAFGDEIRRKIDPERVSHCTRCLFP